MKGTHPQSLMKLLKALVWTSVQGLAGTCLSFSLTVTGVELINSVVSVVFKLNTVFSIVH